MAVASDGGSRGDASRAQGRHGDRSHRERGQCRHDGARAYPAAGTGRDDRAVRGGHSRARAAERRERGVSRSRRSSRADLARRCRTRTPLRARSSQETFS
jgi:hypothetical protein